MPPPHTGSAVMLVLCAVVMLYKLDALEIQLWDEGRNAVNAYEMSQNGHVMVRYYNGAPDFWELKPPLLVWCQAISLRLFGYHEWSIRFPSIVFSLLTVWMLLQFTRGTLKRPLAGYAAVLVLITSPGYIGTHEDVGNHVVRTGDHESALLFFLTASLLAFYRYTQDGWRRKDLIITVAALVGAAYTKSIIALVFLPGMLLYMFWTQTAKAFFQRKEVYLAALAFLACVAAYYGYRETVTPGYLRQVWHNEMLMRYLNESAYYNYQDESLWYYFLNFFHTRFVPWIFLMPVCAVLAWQIKAEKTRALVKLLLAVCISLLLILSAGTSNPWYDAPLYPVMALIVGLALQVCYEAARQRMPISTEGYASVVFLVVVFLFPYGYILHRIHQESIAHHRFADRIAYGKMMKQVRQSFPDIKRYTVLNKVFNTPLDFYVKVFNEQYGYQIQDADSIPQARETHWLFCGQAFHQAIQQQYQYTTLDSCHTCYFIRLQQATTAHASTLLNDTLRDAGDASYPVSGR